MGRGRPGGPPTTSVAGRILREVRHFDTRAVSLAVGARVGAAVGIALTIGVALHAPGVAAAMGAGALLAGVTTAMGGPTPSLRLLALVSLAMGLSAFVGSATGGLGWVHTALVVPWCLLGGLLMALGSPASSVGTQAIAAMIVFGRFDEPLAGAAELAGYVIAGGVVVIAVIATTRRPATLGGQRRAMAAACHELAALARPGPASRSGLAAAGALDAAEASLASLDSGGLEDLGALRALLDVARRARVEVLVIDGLGQRLARLGHGAAAQVAAPLLASLAGVLERVGDALASSPAGVAWISAEVDDLLDGAAGQIAALRSPPGVSPDAGGGASAGPAETPVVPGARAEPAGAGQEAVLAGRLDEHLAALAGQVRAIADLAARSYGHRRRSRRAILSVSDVLGRRERFRATLETLAAHLSPSSSIARHALRLTIVVTVAEVIAHRTGLEHGYWIALTASVVLRPDFSVTVSRGVARVVGTCLGVGIAGLFDLAIRPSTAAMVVTATVFSVAAGATFQASYVAFSGFLTALVVVLLDIVSPGTLSLAMARLADTAIGGALALAAYGLWPSWAHADAWRALARLAHAQRVYLRGVLTALAGAVAFDEAALRSLSTTARRARANAETTVGRSLSEPLARRIDAGASASVLGALRRVSLATHALRTDAAEGRPAAPVPELGLLGEGLDGALVLVGAELDRRAAEAEGAGLLRGEPRTAAGPRSPLPALRRCHGQLVSGLAGRSDVRLLLAETDELVDAVDTAADVLGLAPAVEPGGDATAERP